MACLLCGGACSRPAYETSRDSLSHMTCIKLIEFDIESSTEGLSARRYSTQNTRLPNQLIDNLEPENGHQRELSSPAIEIANAASSLST